MSQLGANGLEEVKTEFEHAHGFIMFRQQHYTAVRRLSPQTWLYLDSNIQSPQLVNNLTVWSAVQELATDAHCGVFMLHIDLLSITETGQLCPKEKVSQRSPNQDYIEDLSTIRRGGNDNPDNAAGATSAAGATGTVGASLANDPLFVGMEVDAQPNTQGHQTLGALVQRHQHDHTLFNTEGRMNDDSSDLTHPAEVVGNLSVGSHSSMRFTIDRTTVEGAFPDNTPIHELYRWVVDNCRRFAPVQTGVDANR